MIMMGLFQMGALPGKLEDLFKNLKKKNDFQPRKILRDKRMQVLKMMVGNNLKETQLQQIVDKTILLYDKVTRIEMLTKSARKSPQRFLIILHILTTLFTLIRK